MKRMLLFLLLLPVIYSCKKSTSPKKEIFLSKVWENGELASGFVYNENNQLAEEHIYGKTPAGDIKLFYIDRYVYDDAGKLKECITWKMPENTPLASKRTYTVDSEGRIKRLASLADDGSVNVYIDHEYDANGRLMTQTWKNKDEKFTSMRSYTWYANGNLKLMEQYNATMQKTHERIYAASDTTHPASWANIRAWPINFYLPFLVSGHVHVKAYSGGLVSEEYRDVVSSQVYNARGMITKQTITTKWINPADPDYPRTMEYEYVEK